MKKIIVIFLTLALILALAGCGKAEAPAPEETAAPEAPPPAEIVPEPEMESEPRPEDAFAGAWYGLVRGLAVCLELRADSGYTLRLPPEEPQSGTWELRDGFILLDGDEPAALSAGGDKLSWPGGVCLSREEPGR